MASTANSIGRRWSAVTWPNSPPPLPETEFPGPYAILRVGPGGAFMSYDVIEHQGFADDERLNCPPLQPGEDDYTANDRRYQLWQREYHAERGEIYLTLEDLDLTSIPAILEWVSTYGVLNLRALDAPATGRQWYSKAAPQSIPLRALAHYPGFGIGVSLGKPHRIGSTDDTLRDEIVALCEAERAGVGLWIIEETLHEFIYGAETVRDLATAWRCVRHGNDPREQTWANSRMPSPDWTESRAVQVVAEFLEGTLSATLERFSPRIYLRDEEGRRTFGSPPISPAPQDVTLFELLMLEIFRHIVEDASYKRCENENCRKLFVRQEGGAEHGQSRKTGVKYCSRHCAKATAQRNSRRRKAAAAARSAEADNGTDASG